MVADTENKVRRVGAGDRSERAGAHGGRRWTRQHGHMIERASGLETYEYCLCIHSCAKFRRQWGRRESYANSVCAFVNGV